MATRREPKTTKKRKPRTPYGYRALTEQCTVLERSLKLPGEWPHRHRLAELDAEYEMGGAWVEAIDTVFPSSWLREQVEGSHEIARSMSWEWPVAIRNIAEVADAIVAAQQATLGHEEVTKRLQVHEQYLGALFEARVARLLRDAGLTYAFASSKGAEGAAADLRIEAEQPFVVEIKHVKNAFRARVPEALTNLISPILPGTFPLGTRVEFDWSGDEVLAIEENDDPFRRIESIAFSALAELSVSLEGARFDEPLEIGIAGAGVVRITPGAAAMPNSISYQTVLQPHMNERRLASRIRRARRQLGGTVGVMVLCGDPDVVSGECTARLAADLMGAEGKSFPELAGAIVFTSTRAANVVEATWPIPNPFAEVRLDALPLREAKVATTRTWLPALPDLFAR